MPVRYVGMSHVHSDGIFGAAAFLADEPEFIGHERLPAALAERSEFYRANLATLLGAASVGQVVAPTRVVHTETISTSVAVG